jgi:uncharacterized protein
LYYEHLKMMINKNKIFNEPVYGFITIPDELIFDIIEHPYFQRLRRIKQLGLTHLVYPGALHTRFHHALGSMHLMKQAIDTLRMKGHDITNAEMQGALIAILLHDIGHGPYSHGLENSILYNIKHEEISELYFQKLNSIFNNALSLAIEIFTDKYHKKFLHQLVSSQLDMDRLDYLKRDSFYTGVSEGVINSDRIINMLNVVDDNLVVESKGIYSIEKFIVARRLMYWQVYFHKTVLSAEYLLVKIIQRARYLIEKEEQIFLTPALEIFLKNQISKKDFASYNNNDLLHCYSLIDDYDVFTCVKIWMKAKDYILSTLATNLVNRSLYKIELQNEPFKEEYVEIKRKQLIEKWKFSADHPVENEMDYFVFTDNIKNNSYTPFYENIYIYYKDGKLIDIADASDQLNVEVLSKTVTKYFLCYYK